MVHDEHEINSKNLVYAKNVKGEVLHISEASSGRRGYFCLGCNEQMQAVKHKVNNRIDYFRHDPKDVKIENKCTYSDETHRHKLAKEILQSIKTIKVPALYKYPPKKVDGAVNQIEKSKFIEAHSVGVEVSFFENEQGEILFGSSETVDDRFLLVRPDVVFFNEKRQPILFIEMVATHGIDIDKVVKLRRLGIDTVQVSIPKDSPENIKNSFYTTTRTKWVYNHVEERTAYISIPSRNTEALPPFDEQQREFFELQESFECRRSEIRNLIRTIERCLESKPYRDASNGVRQEISRAERNSKTHKSRLGELRIEHRERVKERFREDIRKSSDLETRYKSKRNEIDRKSRELEKEKSEYEFRIEEKNRRKESIGRDTAIRIEEGKRRARELRTETERIGRSIKTERERTNDNIKSRETIRTRAREKAQKLQDEFEQLEREGRGRIAEIISIGKAVSNRARQKERYIDQEFERIAVDERREIARVVQATIEEPRNFEYAKRALEREFELLREESIRAIKKRDGTGNNELSRGIHQLLQKWKLCDDLEAHISVNKRYRQAWEFFKSGTYKTGD